jgi:DNA-binding transcriptional LysR family regulator
MPVDRMHMLSVFMAVGETRGFAAAAQRLGLSPAAITRAIYCLESELGVELLRRTTRNVGLTEAGKRYLADIKSILEQVAEVNDAASVSPRGTLVVAAPELFGRSFVMPCIAEYLDRFPDDSSRPCTPGSLRGAGLPGQARHATGARRPVAPYPDRSGLRRAAG